ncbi:Gfo/Idh/MocA family oxidoreductase [Simiduia litorea]|uniref:Gfo/Idh/MocA family protein n=1 Tax=Simiduia litorea TaxID=1435348 RepID=UPI0036F40A7B
MRKIRMGMVGGGEGAFIGVVHRMAAALDGQIELVCGAFSADPQRSLSSGLGLFLSPDRCYPDYQTLFKAEAQLPLGERMDFVAIVTPNHLHLPVACMALESGFDVMSDKPATLSLEECRYLAATVEKTGRLYGLTHTYTGYPLVKEARALVAAGRLGRVKKVVVEYSQGWLAVTPGVDNKQAAWRLDPARAGLSCCMGDIGVHAANLVEYVCTDRLQTVCAHLTASIPDRLLDDDGTVLFETEKGAQGVLIASQISVGEENDLRLRVYGDKASLEWRQQEPNSLWLKFADAPAQLVRAGVGELSALARANLRTPSGHPEGYIEAFANHYRNFAGQIRAHLTHANASYIERDVPDIHDALSGMAFIEAVVQASKSPQQWQRLQGGKASPSNTVQGVVK